MQDAAITFVLLGCLGVAACGRDQPADSSKQRPSAQAARMFIRAAGMVKSLGIT